MRAAYAAAVLVWVSYTIVAPWFTREDVGQSDMFRPFLIAQASLGVMFLGLLFGLWSRVQRHAGQDAVLRAATAVSLGLIAGWIVLAGLYLLSMGFALLDPSVVCGTLISGLTLGLCVGLWPYMDGAPATSSGARQLALLIVGLGLAVLLSGCPVMMVGFTVGQAGGESFGLWAGPVVWISGLGVTAILWYLGWRPLGTGVAVGSFSIGLFLVGTM